MAVWARIDCEKVAELTQVDPANRFHPDIRWLAVSELLAPWVDVSYIFDGTSIAPPTVDYLRGQMSRRIAERRYLAEIGGCRHGDRHVATDDRSKTQIMSALTIVQNGVEVIDWKWREGEFVKLSATDVRDLALTVARHVQACFSQEATIVSALRTADSVVKLLTVYGEQADVGWPKSSP